MVLVGLLTAIRGTPLGLRLAADDRFSDEDLPKGDLIDQTIDGLNFRTLRPRVEILEEYVSILSRIYEPSAYFRRVVDSARAIRRRDPRHARCERRE